MNGPQISTKASILHHLWEFSALCTVKQNKTRTSWRFFELQSSGIYKKKKKRFWSTKNKRSLNKRSPQTWINATEKKVLETDKYDL